MAPWSAGSRRSGTRGPRAGRGCAAAWSWRRAGAGPPWRRGDRARGSGRWWWRAWSCDASGRLQGDRRGPQAHDDAERGEVELVGDRREPLVREAGEVAERAGERRRRHDAHADLVADQ